MRKIYSFLLAALALISALSCNRAQLAVEDPLISVSTKIFQAGPEVQVLYLDVSSNCDWVVLKQDYDGNGAAWIQTDHQKGNGDMTLGIRVTANKETTGRQGQVVLEAQGAKAFIDVIQAGADPKPEPEPEPGPGPGPGPEPEPEPGTTLNLTFDFTGDPLDGWPTSDKYTHVDGGVKAYYPINGVSYEFILADCDGASSARTFWKVEPEGSGPNSLSWASFYRYLGLPAISGYKLTKISCQHATGPGSSPRMLGVCEEIMSSAVHPETYVSGGEPIEFSTQGAYFGFDLSDTVAGKVYYLYCYKLGLRVYNITLTYQAAE